MAHGFRRLTDHDRGDRHEHKRVRKSSLAILLSGDNS